MTIVRDENTHTEALAIVEKYEDFRNYMYPILQRSPRHHGILRDAVMAELFAPIGDLYHAAKTRQVSRLYVCDGRFATLRSHLRFLVRPDIRIMSRHQHAAALRLLAEPGKMLGAWIKKLKASKNPGEETRPAGRAG
jgi:hypothetical protein